MRNLVLLLGVLALAACSNKNASNTASAPGPAGPAGKDGASGNSLPKMYDKNGHYLGSFLSNGAGGNCLFLADGTLACVDGAGRLQNLTDDLSADFVSCVYASADCSGACYIPSSGRYKGAALPGFGVTHKYVGTETVVTTLAAHSRLAANGTRNPDNGTYPSVVAPAVYVPGGGVTFPVAVPIFITQPGP